MFKSQTCASNSHEQVSFIFMKSGFSSIHLYSHKKILQRIQAFQRISTPSLQHCWIFSWYFSITLWIRLRRIRPFHISLVVLDDRRGFGGSPNETWFLLTVGWLQQEVRQKTWLKLDIAKNWSTKAIQDGYQWHLPLWRYIAFFTRRVSQAKIIEEVSGHESNWVDHPNAVFERQGSAYNWSLF